MSDLFNNTSNDYINPSLPECPGQNDTNTFEFLPGREVGIISGNTTILSMDLSDISQVVTAWVQQKQLLQPGEVVYIQGLTKGISYKTQVFPIDGSVAYYNYLDSLYMSVDVSINYYKNFRYYVDSIHATAEETLGIDIASAINIAFGAKGISATVSYDPSNFTFVGSTAGYEYNITAIDASRWVPDTSVVGNSLIEDVSSCIPAVKYPNGAMLGYLLKVTYPNSITDESLLYIDLNHAPDRLIYYEASTGDSNSYVRYDKAVDVGMSGFGTSTTLSAAEYLDYVQSNNKWEKVGVLRIWLAAEDPTNLSVENLITGFYLFNPQTFAVQVEYMTVL